MAVQTPPVTDTNWHYIVATHNGSRVRIYMDGVLKQDVATTLQLTPNTLPLNIGRANANNYFFNGWLDEVAVYPTALPLQTILAHYNRALTPPPRSGLALLLETCAGSAEFVSLDGAGVDRRVLESMNETLVHRGPDSEGAFVDGRVGLAARRLAIIDLAGGDQPIANEDGSITVVQNGEIYNYRELRAELERAGGHRFSTQSDTEVLVHLYEEHGPDFVRRLRGMFAIALWDERNRRLVVARDRFGIKPLYYRLQDDSVSFASELKALLRMPGFSREVDLDALDAFLAFGFVPAPLTIFREARKLPPGSVLIWQDGTSPNLRIERYARPSPVLSRSGPLRGRGNARRGAARAPPRFCPRASGGRRSRRCLPLGRDRFFADRRARLGGELRARADVHRSASRSATSTSAELLGSSPIATRPITTSSSCAPTAPRFCPRWPMSSTSRSPTRPRSRPI